MSGIVIAIAVGVFVTSLVAFAATVMMPSTENSATEDRLADLASRRGGKSSANSEDGDNSSLIMGGELDKAQNVLENLLKSIPGLSTYLEQADAKMSSAKFGMIVAGCFAGGLVLGIVSPLPILLAPVVGLVFAAGPLGWLVLKRKKRLNRFGQQMPEALELLSRSLRAGHSLDAGFGLVGSEVEAPLGIEFARAFEEQKFGIPLDEAIEEMAHRVPNMDLRFFATAVILQRSTGGDLAEILDKIGDLVRERFKIWGQVQALTGEGRLSGIVLLALPPLLFVTMVRINKEYVMILFTDEFGKKLLAFGIIMQILGAIVIKKIVNIKV